MDRASSLIYPGSKTLAGWWRQLAPLKPETIGIGYVFLHRIEAPVNVRAELLLDPFTRLVLQALTLEPAGDFSVSRLQERLRLPAPMVQRVLAGMHGEGLLANGCTLTERGVRGLAAGAVPVSLPKRRTFAFLEQLDPMGQRLGPPQFVPLAECAGVAWPVDETHRLDTALLTGCIEQSATWKQATGFPLDIEPLAETMTESWQQVVIDRPERVMLVVIRVNNEVLGFAVKVDGWTLFDRAPVLRLPSAALFPELAQSCPMLVWQEAWRGWCKQRNLPANEVEICALHQQGSRLEVQAPPRLVQRLQAAKSDLFKGDAWILVGDGYLRTAVQLVMRHS